MRLVKFIVAVSLATTFSVSATQYKLQDDGPVYWEARDTLSRYMVKSGECLVLYRMGDNPSKFPHLVNKLLAKFTDERVRMYVPYMTYSCMISGDPVYAGYIPDRYVKKCPGKRGEWSLSTYRENLLAQGYALAVKGVQKRIPVQVRRYCHASQRYVNDFGLPRRWEIQESPPARLV